MKMSWMVELRDFSSVSNASVLFSAVGLVKAGRLENLSRNPLGGS